MERVSRYLEGQPDDVPVTTIYRAVKGKREYLAEAIAFLVGDSFATEQPGNRGSRLIRSVKPYRGPAPTLPHPSPAASTPGCPPVPSSLDEDRTGSTGAEEQLDLSGNGHVDVDPEHAPALDELEAVWAARDTEAAA
jgi:hypothetical protein